MWEEVAQLRQEVKGLKAANARIKCLVLQAMVSQRCRSLLTGMMNRAEHCPSTCEVAMFHMYKVESSVQPLPMLQQTTCHCPLSFQVMTMGFAGDLLSEGKFAAKLFARMSKLSLKNLGNTLLLGSQAKVPSELFSHSRRICSALGF
ncbi:unnamed protein product [Ostreobium quekettii]|uniref:Uncharacterized protein n=1 Tax=Ostreobium quekettii TaxID=121088 RepID=A0A8S1ITW5_9CHLO|nr:unnamed protein product [Ostreobium quekettii]